MELKIIGKMTIEECKRKDMQTANNIFQYFKTHKPVYEGNQVWCIKYGIA